jgi:hypothetical protein
MLLLLLLPLGRVPACRVVSLQCWCAGSNVLLVADRRSLLENRFLLLGCSCTMISMASLHYVTTTSQHNLPLSNSC